MSRDRKPARRAYENGREAGRAETMAAILSAVPSLRGCSACHYDEAEGALVDHCDACCRRIAGELVRALS